MFWNKSKNKLESLELISNYFTFTRDIIGPCDSKGEKR